MSNPEEGTAPSDGVSVAQEQDENAIPVSVNPPVPEPVQGGDQEEVLLTTGPDDDPEEEDDGLEEKSDDVPPGDDQPGENPPKNEPAEG